MIVALAIPRAAWLTALALLAQHLIAPLAALFRRTKGSDVQFRLSEVRKLEFTSDPRVSGYNVGVTVLDTSPKPNAVGSSGPEQVSRHSSDASSPGNANLGTPPKPATGDGGPISSPFKSEIQNPKSEIPSSNPCPIQAYLHRYELGQAPPGPPRGYTFQHNPDATLTDVMREMDALWQTLTLALEKHFDDNIARPADVEQQAPGAPEIPPASGVTEHYLVAHTPRQLNTLTLILKRIQTSRLNILQTLAGDADPVPITPEEDEILHRIQSAIAPMNVGGAVLSGDNADHQFGQTSNVGGTVHDPSQKSNGVGHSGDNAMLGQSVQSEIRNPKSEIQRSSSTAKADEIQNPKSEIEVPTVLDQLLSIISVYTDFTPDLAATPACAMRQCDALWQHLQTAITPLAARATTVSDIDNITIALKRLHASRKQAVSFLTVS